MLKLKKVKVGRTTLERNSSLGSEMGKQNIQTEKVYCFYEQNSFTALHVHLTF